MDLIVHDVIKLKNRGNIIAVNAGGTDAPKPGDKFSCGNCSWIVRSMETHDGYSYWLLIKPLSGSKFPMSGYILDKVDDN